MRKVLNILESAAMAHDNKVGVEDVYNCTGKPSPAEVDKMFKGLLEDKMNEATEGILALKTERSLTLEDIVRELHLKVMGCGLPQDRKIFLIRRLADIEGRIAIGCNEKLQVVSMVGAFVEARVVRG